MEITVHEVTAMYAAQRANSDAVTIKCWMNHRDMEEFIAQCCEQMGDEVFFKYIETLRD